MTSTTVTLEHTELTWTTEDGRTVGSRWLRSKGEQARMASFIEYLDGQHLNPQTTVVATTYTVGEQVQVQGHGRIRDGRVVAVGRTQVTVEYVRNLQGDLHVAKFGADRVHKIEQPEPAAEPQQLEDDAPATVSLPISAEDVEQAHLMALLENERVERCRQPLAGTGGEPCQAPAGHAGRGCDASGQPWSHEAPADELDTEQAAERYGVCRWDRLPQRPGHWDLPNHRALLERDHAEALEENAAHDAAVAAAIPEDTYRAAELLADRLVQGAPMYANRNLTTHPLTPAELQQIELATNLAGQQLQAQHRQLPRAMRYGASRLTLIPPR